MRYPGNAPHWLVFRWTETDEIGAIDISKRVSELQYPPGIYSRRKRYELFKRDFHKQFRVEESPFIRQETVRHIQAETEAEAIEQWLTSSSS